MTPQSPRPGQAGQNHKAQRNHHVVAKAYQLGFAAERRVRLVYKYLNQPPEQLKHVRKALVERGFLTVSWGDSAHDQLEDAFARAECHMFALTRQIRYPVLRDGDDRAIKALAALLFARSYRMQRHGTRLTREVIDEHKESAPEDPRLRAAFIRDHGRDPETGEIELIIEAQGTRWVNSGAAQVGSIQRMYQRALERFAPLHVSLYDAAALRHGFVYSDNPLVLARDIGLRDVDNEDRLIAIGDADFIYFPLNRRTGVCLTSAPEGHSQLEQRQVQILNNAMWRSAHRIVACHPDEDWAAACAVSKARPALRRAQGLPEG